MFLEVAFLFHYCMCQARTLVEFFFRFHLSLFYVHVYFAWLYVSAPCVFNVQGGQKKTSDPLGTRVTDR